jgi:hypothetical protein
LYVPQRRFLARHDDIQLLLDPIRLGQRRGISGDRKL